MGKVKEVNFLQKGGTWEQDLYLVDLCVTSA